MKTIAVCCLFLSLLFSGCAKSEYIAPSAVNNDKYTFTLNKSFDATWQALIEHVSSTFFDVKNFEKDSGLIILEFGISDAEKYVDCGLFNNQSYAAYLTKNYASKLVGSMNINLVPIDENKTKIRVHAKYKFSVANLRWNFTTGSNDFIMMESTGAAYGAGLKRTCQPSYQAEQAIFDAIESISSQ